MISSSSSSLILDYEDSIKSTYSKLSIPYNPYTILDLCSGIGGFTLGLISSGLMPFATVSTYCDNDPFCQSVLSENFGKPVLSDIRDLTLSLGQYDIIQASIPCQPHSHASGSYRKGSADKRDLGNDFIRLVSECRPLGFLLENVSGFRTSENGNYFKLFLSNLTDATTDDPYLIEWGIYSAAQVGAVHLRKRFWILGYKYSYINNPTPSLTKPFINHLPSLFNSFFSFLPSYIQRSLLTHDSLESSLSYCCDTETKPFRKSHLRAYGNAIVPQVASKIWQRFFHTLHSPNHFSTLSTSYFPLSSVQSLLPSEAFLYPYTKHIYPQPKWGHKVLTKGKLWLPTPIASNSLHPGHRTRKPGTNKHLPHALIPWRVPFTDRKHNDKLNPDFVRQMMGFPHDWLSSTVF